MTTLLLLGLAAAAAWAFRQYRAWHLGWGASDAGAAPPAARGRRAVPLQLHGDARDHRGGSPEDVWPWLVQIGFGRAGWYSYDWLDNLGRPSADRVVPELQGLRVGDWVPMSAKVDERTAFRVAALEPNRMLLWTKPDSTWAWVLDPVDGGSSTRVLSRLRCRHDPTSLPGLAGILLMEIGDFPMFRKLLLNLRRRAEARATARKARDPDAASG